MKTAVSWLEEAILLKREENRVRVFPSSLKTRTFEDAKKLIDAGNMTDGYRRNLLALVQSMMNAPPDQGISTDELSGQSGLSPGRLRKALGDLETLGITSNDTVITIFVHLAVEDPSEKRFLDASGLEADLVGKLREYAPDLGIGDTPMLNLKITSQELRDANHPTVRPDIVDA